MWHALWSYRLFRTDHAGKWSPPNHPYMQPPHLRDGKRLIHSSTHPVIWDQEYYPEVPASRGSDFGPKKAQETYPCSTLHPRGTSSILLLAVNLTAHLSISPIRESRKAMRCTGQSGGKQRAGCRTFALAPTEGESPNRLSLTFPGRRTRGSPPLLGFLVSYEET